MESFELRRTPHARLLPSHKVGWGRAMPRPPTPHELIPALSRQFPDELHEGNLGCFRPFDDGDAAAPIERGGVQDLVEREAGLDCLRELPRLEPVPQP